MNYKILTKNGQDNTNIDGARNYHFNSGMRDGIVKGALNEGTFTSPTSNSIFFDTCELRISGHRVVINKPFEKTYNENITIARNTRYSLVAQIVVDDNSNVTFDLLIQPATTTLVKDNLFKTLNGRGTYQVEIGRFTLQTDNTVTDIARTIDIITGGKGDDDGKMQIGNVTVNTLDAGMEAEADIELRYEPDDGITYIDVNLGIPQGYAGADGVGIEDIEISPTSSSDEGTTYEIEITLENGNKIQAGDFLAAKGDKGDQGVGLAKLTFKFLQDTDAGREYEVEYELTDGTIASGGIITLPQGGGVDVEELNKTARLEFEGATLIPEDADLNAAEFYEVGNYYSNGSRKITNSPTTDPFIMQVFDIPNKTLTSGGGYITYRCRRIFASTSNGDEYMTFDIILPNGKIMADKWRAILKENNGIIPMKSSGFEFFPTNEDYGVLYYDIQTKTYKIYNAKNDCKVEINGVTVATVRDLKNYLPIDPTAGDTYEITDPSENGLPITLVSGNPVQCFIGFYGNSGRMGMFGFEQFNDDGPYKPVAVCRRTPSANMAFEPLALERYTVSLDTAQEISGKKNFSGGLQLNGTDILLKIYPVGAIYLSVNSTSPASLFGGTWEQLKDRFLLGAGSTYTNGAIGGSSNAIVVSHNHTFTGSNISGSITDVFYGGNNGSGALSISGSMTKTGIGNGSSNGWGTVTFGATPSGTISTNGSSGTGANMPPYLVVYMWKRTA